MAMATIAAATALLLPTTSTTGKLQPCSICPTAGAVTETESAVICCRAVPRCTLARHVRYP